MKNILTLLLLAISTLSYAVANEDDREIYKEIKENFLSSSFCDPTKIVNDPTERANGILMSKVAKKVSFLGSTEKSNQSKVLEFQIFADEFELGSELIEKIKSIIYKMKPYSPTNDVLRRSLVASSKGLVLQKIAQNSLNDPRFKIELIISGLVDSYIFSEDEDGNVYCPFISEDAFTKAIGGHRKLLGTKLKSIKNVNLLSIIDFTRPSNERRLFVIDLKSKNVIHNTTVAHGIGKGRVAGLNGPGSHPELSNVQGSKMSSDGFMLATQASYGNLFGPNVLLKGLDINNKNITARSIVVHGWSTPYGQYTSGLEESVDETETYVNIDAYEEFRNVDFDRDTQRGMEKALDRLSSSLSSSKFLATTEGCPGVPLTVLSHLDAKGRKNKSSLELLREDLPGSIVFTYSGPEMTSNFF